jgi:hypothetical protein
MPATNSAPTVCRLGSNSNVPTKAIRRFRGTAVLLNPLVFIGIPLGIWLLLSSKHDSVAKRPPRFIRCPHCDAANESRATKCEFCEKPITGEHFTDSEYELPNPKLIHCPDCDRHVSRLATSCPNCGRPLTPEKFI